MRIQHNIAALNSYRNLTTNNNAVSKNLEKLSSGYKINRAGDDAAGLAISEKMRAQITGLETAQKNANDGISLVQTAEGAMTEIHSMLNRMVELATQSANGTYDDEVSRANLQKEVDSLKDEINRIADSTNFNGINLLDGSLASTGGAKSVKIEGIGSTNSAATSGKFVSSTALAALSGYAENDEVSYTVSLDNGDAYTVNFTLKLDPADTVNKQKGLLVGDDGKTYGTIANLKGGDVTAAELDTAIMNALKDTDLAKNFTISSDGNGTFTFENIEKGNQGQPKVAAFDQGSVKGGTLQTMTAIGVKPSVTALDNGREIDAANIVLYDGTNYDDAVFSINGHKFVVMTGIEDGASTDYMNATKGLGSDVTILVADGDNTENKGLKQADPNFIQNINKIAEVTGLTVTDAVNETSFGAQADTGVAPGAGIRLSAGKGAVGGLQLQISDTADDFNKLRVSVSDMHVKAMGIDGIDIGTQAGAQAAVDKIKSAINYVSSTRGDLGAIQNRLEHTINNLSVTAENMTAAESRIRDVDMAQEMMAYTKNNILVQASQAMLAQANQIPQGVLQLLQ